MDFTNGIEGCEVGSVTLGTDQWYLFVTGFHKKGRISWLRKKEATSRPFMVTYLLAYSMVQSPS